jgi:hypothetical protein
MPFNLGPLELFLTLLVCISAAVLLAGLVGVAVRRVGAQGGRGGAGRGAPSSSLADELERLEALRRSGALSEEEFQRAKQRLLD